MEAMQSQTVDVVQRMKEITLVMQTPEQVLEAQGVTTQDIEGTVGTNCRMSIGLPFSFLCEIFIFLLL